MSILIAKWVAPPPPVSEMQVHAKETKQVLETCLMDRLETCKETRFYEEPANSN